MADVVVVRWPEQRDELPGLAERRVPRLLLVSPSADPPEASDVLEDWIRLPGDDRDVRARLRSLRVRASHLDVPPEVDAHGRLVFRGRWVQLSPIHERLVRRLLAGRECVMGDTELRAAGWPGAGDNPSPNALRVHLHRLRRLVAPLGLEIRAVRGEGWVLQRAAPAD